ncbi:helix-turn-helix domain-containing protein [Virgibacillus halodenitrificans]|uniref:helix-turn-helix domain-containing protein n=1 Tax=Virgibacillus halodenitrificans TaxID=1482 RepID=UPI001F2D8E52|nr:helix-turn-helix transcriptional regulator [Virgibacillus halodenitrificans]
MSGIGELLKQLRGKESLREASKRIGISHTYLDTIEKGYDKRSGKTINPSPDTLRLISKAYNYDYENLLRKAGYLDPKKEAIKKANKSLKDYDFKFTSEEEKRNAIINRIADEFPNIDLMFDDLSSFSAEELQDVYDYIKFKKSQKEK